MLARSLKKKMGRILFCVIFCTFLSFEVVNADCNQAGAIVYVSPCYPQLTTFGNTSLCNSTDPCRMLLDDALNNCSSTVRPQSYIAVTTCEFPMQDLLYMEITRELNLLCVAPPECYNATKNLENDYFCNNYRNNISAQDPNNVCNGTCRNLLDNLVIECGAQVSVSYLAKP